MPSDGTEPGVPGATTPARYEQISELARGGMAALHLARVRGPSGFTKYVVLKRILSKWADEAEFVEMFLDEARLAATLDHPNAVHVYDAGRDEQGPFFAMEYIHGEDLRQLQRRLEARGEPMPLRHAVAITIGIAAGLHHAHERRDFDGHPLSIIHRDVSPSNVLVTYEGGVKVVDFGIAKASLRQHATRPSVRKGKAPFMSPEQCRGDAIDRRSDVFSLGAVLHQLLTGRLLFTGDNEFVAMNRIINHDAPPPSASRPDLPPALDEIVATALARDPRQRYPSARAMQRALEDFAAAHGISPSATALADFVLELSGGRAYPWESGAPRPAQGVTRADGGTPANTDEGDEIATALTARPLATAPATTVVTRPRSTVVWVLAPVLLGIAVVIWLGTGPLLAGTAAPPRPSPTAATPATIVPAAAPPLAVGSSTTDPSAATTASGATTGDPTGTTEGPGTSTASQADPPPATARPRGRKVRPRRTKPSPTPPPAAPTRVFDPDGPAPRREPR